MSTTEHTDHHPADNGDPTTPAAPAPNENEETSMQRRISPTLAIILAAGIAAGIALARPGSSDGADTQAVAAAAADGAPAADQADDGYQRGGRATGDRGAAPAPAPADEAALAAAPTAAISIEGFAFDGPQSVPAGTAITVTNLDSAPHTLTFRSVDIGTGNLNQGQSATVTAPTEPGTYDFFCEIHPSMEGRIVITG